MKHITLSFILIFSGLLGYPQKLNSEYGLMVIDVQKFFIPNHKESIYTEFKFNHPLKSDEIISNLQTVINWSNKNRIKTFVTFEGSDSGRFDLPDELTPLLPKTQTHHFIKTNFNALQHPEFKEAVMASGIKKWIVVGAETDVCVYQTVKGLRKLNYDVYLISEAVYSGRINTENALYNLKKYGAKLISVNDLPKIKSLKASKAEYTVQENLNAENLVLTIVEPAQTSLDTSSENIRLNELKKFATALSIPIEYYQTNNKLEPLQKNKIRLVAGNITKINYDIIKNQTEGEIIVLSDCIPGQTFEKLNSDWYTLTYKILFYDILGNVNPNNSSELQKSIKNRSINWPDYTQN